MDPRKIPTRLDNPVDNILIRIADKISPFLYAHDITPNTITMLSALTIVFAVYYLIHDNIVGFGIFYAISYWLDCVDGHYARKYSMTTIFGDYLDHITDVVGILAIAVVAVLKYRPHITPTIIALLVATGFLMATMFGCQERWSSFGNHSDTLKWLKQICPAKETKQSLERTLRRLRYFGAGTANIVVFIIVCYLHYMTNFRT